MLNGRPNSFLSSPIEEWARVFAHRVIDNNGCLEFAGSRTTANYGRLTYRAKWWTAHRLSFFLKGEHDFTPEQFAKIILCHRCDNPPCINPAHLYAGSHSDNFRDSVERGRAGYIVKPERFKIVKHPRRVYGEACGSTKLTKLEVLAIREARLTGERLKVLSERFKVSQSQISVIANGHQWKPETM